MISIVIPTLNEEKCLPKLLESIKSQTYTSYEIIVADNSSKDRTIKIAKRFGCKTVKGGLPGAGRNSGAKAAGFNLLFLDADTILEDKRFLEKLLEKIRKDSPGIATCNILPDSKDAGYRFYYFLKNFFNRHFGYFSVHVSGQCLFIRKDLFMKIGGYDETLFLGEEHDLAKRAVKSGATLKFYSDLEAINSVRRIKKEGFFPSLLKTIYSEIYRIIFGKIKRKLFNYEFGNHLMN